MTDENEVPPSAPRAEKPMRKGEVAMMRLIYGQHSGQEIPALRVLGAQIEPYNGGKALSVKLVHDYVSALVKRGFLDRVPGARRGLTATDAGWAWFRAYQANERDSGDGSGGDDGQVR